MLEDLLGLSKQVGMFSIILLSLFALVIIYEGHERREIN